MQPTVDTGTLSISIRLAFGLGAGVFAGLLAEGITNYSNTAISERFKTLLEGVEVIELKKNKLFKILSHK